MGLLSGAYTPQVQEAITRWGSRLTFAEAQEELAMMWGIEVSEGTVRNTTLRYGQVANEIIEEEVDKIEKETPEPEAKPDKLVMSVDGAMVALTNGEWREVKLVAFGEFKPKWDAKKGAITAKTEQLSYFARAEPAAAFSRMALYEWHRRGGDNAKQVVAVNDGAVWIQAFIDYHCPKATRIIDFAHAQSYVAAIGKAIYGAETEAFNGWFARMSYQLGHHPPRRVLSKLRFLQQQHPDHPQTDTIEQALFYLDNRQEMIDYDHFRKAQLPIGSGIVESGHKVVMQRRMKQAGMRWAESSLNPMLTLRMALCNKVWFSQWQAIQHHCHQARRRRRIQLAKPSPNKGKFTPITEADCQQLTKLARTIERKRKRRPWQNNRYIFPYRQPLPHKN